MRNPDPLEKDIERNVCNYAKKHGWLTQKYTSPSHRSVPDRIFIQHGKVFFIEFKRLGKKPTKLQDYEHRKLRNQGMYVEVVDTVAKGRKVIDEWDTKRDKADV